MANTDTLQRKAMWMMNDLPAGFLRAEEDGHGQTLLPRQQSLLRNVIENGSLFNLIDSSIVYMRLT